MPRDNLEAKLKEVCQAVNNEVRMPNIAMKAGIGAIEAVVSVHRRPITTYFDQAKLASDSIKKDATRSIAFYNESMRQSIADRIFILDNLDRAIREGHIKVYYQPVMRAMTGKLCGCEALARWIAPPERTPAAGQLHPRARGIAPDLASRLLRHRGSRKAPALPY